MALNRAHWVLQRYGKRLQAQMESEGSLELQKPFVEAGKAPRRGFAPSRLIILGFLIVTGLLSTAIFLVAGELMIRLFQLQDAQFTGSAADLVAVMILLSYFALLAAVSAVMRRTLIDGRFFARYDELLTYVRALKTPEDVLAYAPTLRASAGRHIRGPYDLYRMVAAARAGEDHSAYYRSERLLDTITLLEQRYPFVSKDDDFRQRYWDFGRAIYGVLLKRNPELVKRSLFAGFPPGLLSHPLSRSGDTTPAPDSNGRAYGEPNETRVPNLKKSRPLRPHCLP
jgi:hypothetical protein